MSQDLRRMIAAELSVAPDSLPDDKVIAMISGWDSMAWINVITALERATGRPFPIDDIDEVKTIGQLIRAAQGLHEA